MNLFRYFRKQSVCRLPAAPDGRLARKYSSFKALLENNNAALDVLAELEQLYYGGGMFNMAAVRDACGRLADATAGLVTMLDALTGKRHPDLREVLARVEGGLAAVFQAGPPVRGANVPLALPLCEVDPAMTSWLAARPPTWRPCATVSACPRRTASPSPRRPSTPFSSPAVCARPWLRNWTASLRMTWRI